MSFGLSHGRDLDTRGIEVSAAELPPLPDEIVLDPRAGFRDPRALFAHPDRPLELEIGSGKGTFLARSSPRRPDVNFLGVEWAGEFFAYAADRLRRAGATNVRMLKADAVEFLKWRVPDGVLHVIHLYFSDPWPKRKHHKNRVIQDEFLAHAWRTLVPGGELRLVTDHDEYWSWMEAHFERWTSPVRTRNVPDRIPVPAFERRAFIPPEGVGEDELVGTNFERKYRDEGRSFRAIVLRRPAAPA
ncbi:MAG: tRNA (guanosine(46)-N7)-methyltransferase TrmB [Phycisphaerae bacterium]|nr:tRNA (guanosine(46)-N7)-methyltransferase TrmB [Phycisphaerae bacterium]